MTDIASLGFAVDSAPLATGSAELNKLAASAKKAEDAATGMGTRVQDAAKKAENAAMGAAVATGNLGQSYGTLEVYARRAATAIGLIVAALTSGALSSLADIYSDLNARVGLAVKNMEASGIVMDRLGVIARRTYSSLELTAESFIRNANTLRNLGKTTSQQLDYTEALNLALVVSGAKQERARMVQESMSRAMAGGALRGQELNTIIESGGRVAEVLAEELGVTTNQLRRMGEQGKITADVIYNALTKRLQQLQEEAERMPATIGDAFLILRNSFLQMIGVYDQSNKLSESLAVAIIGVADSLGIIAKVAVVAATALGMVFAGSILAGAKALAIAIGTSLVAAFGALRLAMTAHPILFVAGVIATVAQAAYQFSDEIRKSEGPLRIFGAVLDWVIDKLYIFADVYQALVAKFSAAPINDDAMQAVALNIAKLHNDLKEFEAARDAAMAKGSDTSRTDRTIASIKGQIAATTKEYWDMDETRKAGELSFTDLVQRETEKRRRAWEDARAPVIEAPFDLPGTGGPNPPDTKAFDKRVESVRRQVEAMRIEAETYGMTEAAAARYRVQKELENEAVKAGIELSTMRRAEILAEADALGIATAELESKRAIEEAQTTIESERQQYEQRIEMLQEFEDARILSAQESAELRKRIEMDYATTVAQSITATTDRVASTLDALAGAMDASSKKQFEQAKKLSIASAVLKGFEAAVSSYAAGAKIGGPPLGAVWASASLLATGAQISKIKSTTFNSGASSGGSSGGSSAGSQTTREAPQGNIQAAPQQGIIVNLVGSRYTREDVRELLEQVNTARSDGSRYIVGFG